MYIYIYSREKSNSKVPESELPGGKGGSSSLDVGRPRDSGSGEEKMDIGTPAITSLTEDDKSVVLDVCNIFILFITLL